LTKQKSLTLNIKVRVFLIIALLKPDRMKKKSPLFIALLFVIALSACKKDYECNCVDNTGIEPLLPPTSTSYTGLSQSEADDIEDQCETNSLFSVYTCTFEEK
jgi:hypothetical protein